MKINISTIIEAIEMADDNFTFFLSDDVGVKRVCKNSLTSI